jgi:hypothetical protein
MVLVLVLMALTLVVTLVAGLVLTTTSETLIAASFRGAMQARYAAEAAVEWALADVAARADWASIADGSAPSTFVDGPPDGVRPLADGSTVDLTALVRDSGGWHLYAYGPLGSVIGEPSDPPFYLVVFADDGGAADRLKLRAEAFGWRGAHRVVEAVVSRRAAPPPRLESWREVR